MPEAFVKNYVHWYDHDTGDITFISRDKPWHFSDSDQWQLHRSSSSWLLQKDNQTLINLKSKDAQRISSLFRNVEDAPYIHILYDSTSHSIKIELPRLKLDFHVDSGKDQVYSRQYRGMLLDEDQGTGTLVGLTSKLVLRRSGTANDRLILIPEGALNYRKSLTHHVSVSISRQDNTTVHAYQLDMTLGRVLDSGALQSKLLLCLLHALTSHWLPDPHTGYTGTEAALTILRSAAVRSFSSLSLENVLLLNKIANLSPRRAFYPPYERVMQQIEWDSNLPFASQHGDYSVLVNEIFNHEKEMALFFTKNIFQGLDRNITAWQTAIDSVLRERASIRCSTFFVAEFGAEHFQTMFDLVYEARDRKDISERGQRAFLAASMILREEALLDQPIVELKAYQDYFRNADVTGFVSAREPPVLCYDSKWLEPPSPLVQELWCTLHHYLVTKSNIGSDFDILIWLATMAYAIKADMDVIRAFVAFYRMPQLAFQQVPEKSRYNLSKGSTFKFSEVQQAAKRNVLSYDDSAEAQLPKVGLETDNQHLSRIENLFKARSNTAVQAFVTALQCQWPCAEPSTPTGDSMNTYLNTSWAMDELRRSFESWNNNRIFEEYLKATTCAIERLPASPIPEPIFDAIRSSRTSSLEPNDRHCDSAMIFDSTPPNVAFESLEADETSRLKALSWSPLASTPNSLATESGVEDQLEQFCKQLDNCATTVCEKNYVADLRDSCNALQERGDDMDAQHYRVDQEAQETLRQHLLSCEEHFKNISRRLGEILATGTSRSNTIASLIKLSPRLPPSFWLKQLNRDHYDALPVTWADAMIEYALSVTHLHRAQRLVALLDKPVELNEELQHTGHVNWDPRDHPETLLLEAESGILVRKVQAAIAAEMIEPPESQNTVMQLNMGEGKSSTIVPIVAAALADKDR